MTTQVIAGAMMLKNESKRILVTLKTLEGIIKKLIIFDTGSTDNTLELVSEWCNSNGVELHTKIGEFVDFSRSRNVLSDFADTIEGYDFILFLDCNDELIGGQKLLEECEKFALMPNKVFMVRQKWLTGTFINKYLNSRLVKRNCGWRYKKRVHEYLAPPENEEFLERPNVTEEVYLYQNRNDDDDKTSKRFQRDKELLSADVKEFNDTRDIFYLAQTLGCLNEFDEAYNLYQKRGENPTGFWEERFHSYLRSGEICISIKNDLNLAIINLIKSLTIDFRVEPLILLSQIYQNKGEHILAYHFLHTACQLEYPSKNILFIGDNAYSYDRYQKLSVVCYYVGKYTEGIEALDKIASANVDVESHKTNRKFYDDAFKEGKKDAELFDPIELKDDFEEVYKSFIKDSEIAFNEKNLDTLILKCLQGFELSHHITTLIILAEYFRINNLNYLAWMFIELVLMMKEPVSGWYKKIDYNYHKYHITGIVGFNVGKFDQGKQACLTALKTGHNVNIDRQILMYYLNKPSLIKQGEKNEKSEKNGETYETFKNRRLLELNNLPKRQAEAKIKLEWKLKKK